MKPYRVKVKVKKRKKSQPDWIYLTPRTETENEIARLRNELKRSEMEGNYSRLSLLLCPPLSDMLINWT